MGPVTWMGASTSDCASEARSGSYAQYFTFKLDRRKQVRDKPDLCRGPLPGPAAREAQSRGKRRAGGT